jgi:two-component system, OmpR family, sensor kinase
MRRRLTLVVLLAVAIALTALSMSAFLVLTARLDGTADAGLGARADAVIATLASDHGTVTMLDTPADDALDAGVWVFDSGGRAVVRAPATADMQRAVDTLIAGRVAARTDVDGATRLLARPFVLAGGVTGMVVVAQSLLPFQQTEQDALIAMGLFGAIVLLVTLLGTRLFLHLALRPVARMTAQARDWSEHDPEHRFEMGPAHDELTALGATLDSLLARSAAALRYEQRLTAEIAHELRTPLTNARVVAELALRRPRSEPELRTALSEVDTAVAATAEALDALLAAAATPGRPRGMGDAAQAAELACDEARRLPEAASLTLRMTRDGDVPAVGCDTRHLVRTLAPLLDNAVRAARAEVLVAVRTDQDRGEVVLAVIDDGPGISPSEADAVLEPGVRGGAAETRPGSGLGLALATRLARSAGGRIAIVPGVGGRVELRLPPIGAVGAAS